MGHRPAASALSESLTNTEPQTYGKDLLDQSLYLSKILCLTPKNIKVWEMQSGSTRETGWIDDRLSSFGLLDPFFFLSWEEPVKGGQEAEDSTWCLCKFLLGASKNSGWMRGWFLLKTQKWGGGPHGCDSSVEPSYNDLKFTVWNCSYFCTNLILT